MIDDLGIGDSPVEEDELDLNLQEDQQDDMLNELIDLLSEIDEEKVLEEELVVDTSEQKHGWIQTDAAALAYQEELELARTESTKFKE